MRFRRLSSAAALSLLALSCGPAQARPRAPLAARTAPHAAPDRQTKDPLKDGLAALRASRYAEAEKLLEQAARGPKRDAALAGVGQAELETGRYADALATSKQMGKSAAPEAAWIAGKALQRQGKLADAAAALQKVAQLPEARRARLLLGEILIDMGKRSDAEAPLMTLVDDYNNDKIGKDDADGLAMVGRAADLLRVPEDANDAFNQSERAAGSEPRVQTLLWRAELFLDKYDPGHAEEVLRDALKIAPDLPEAHVLMASVKLDQALDFDAAEAEADHALKVNPNLTGAYFVKAGIHIRDEDLPGADQQIDAGLKIDPADLPLLSLRAAVRFLSDDPAGFDQAKQAVLALNGQYSRMYDIIGDFADWEHRYDEIVKMMREAVQIDPDDAKALAQLGLNLIRAGNAKEGVATLDRAFKKDGFNVRVYNTLNLFQQTIPHDYVDVPGKVFNFRFRKDEKAILERYVPQLLDLEWHKLTKKYGFTPATPIGVELYGERQNFAIRTDGLPNTAIQGVCFGHTLAAMSPHEETFNLGMTVWHELSHVFHIQLSKAHVPRWFTEGLAEYETLAERPEWSRHMDLDLYQALREDRLPKVGAMSQAFTRAEQLSDVATAYYASSQILVMLVDKHGFDKLPLMLRLWGEGKRTPEVVQTALGMTTEQLDAEFKQWAAEKLARYAHQFVPVTRAGPTDKAKAAAAAAPKDAMAQVRLALALLRDKDGDGAQKALDAALALGPKLPDAVWLAARLDAAQGKKGDAEAKLHELVAGGHDGYMIEMALADVAESKNDAAGMKAAFEAASKLDPSQSEPIEALVDMAHKAGDAAAELDGLKKLVDLDGHDPRVYRRLMQDLIDKKLYKEAVDAGSKGVWSGMEQLSMHKLFGEALIGAKMIPRAVYELETAVLCDGDPKDKADAYALLAEAYSRVPNRAAAAKALAEAKRLDPANARLKTLKL